MGLRDVPEDRITKVQRWLDLIAYLVARRLPVAVEELMERLPAYARGWVEGGETTRASVRRMFERDKDELRALGIPIETVEYSLSFGREQVEGYRIRRRDFYLPYLKLLGEAGDAGAAAGGVAKKDGATGVAKLTGEGRRQPPQSTSDTDTIEIPREEATKALRGLRTLADLPAFPLAGAARSAYRKLTFDLDPQLAAGEGDGADEGGAAYGPNGAGAAFGRSPNILFTVPPEAVKAKAHLDVLSPALLARKCVSFRYHAMGRNQVSHRQVHPWGLLFQHSRWYLVGWDLDRDAERMFRVDRMDGVEANTRKPNTPDYELPEGPILEKYRNREAWELGEPDESVQARARFRFPTSLWAQRNRLGTLVEEDDDGAALREFTVREPHAFLRWILSLEGEADIEAPPELRDGLRTMAREVAALYGDRPAESTADSQANAEEEGSGEAGNG
jgi:predicted DNA-binding transcriptional regulator YafY